MTKKSDKPSIRTLMEAQFDFESESRKAIAVGVKNGWVHHGSKTSVLRGIVENARRKGWIK